MGVETTLLLVLVYVVGMVALAWVVTGKPWQSEYDRLLDEASRIEDELRFSSDFFIGKTKGPVMRCRLNARLDAVQARLREIEEADTDA